MRYNRFWCSQCKKEFQANEVEERVVDGIWGEGRWWYCRTCGNRLISYPEIGEKEQKVILRVKQSLAEVQEFGKTLSADKTCHLLLNIGQLYSENGSPREAYLVFFNASRIAEQNNLSELATSANTLFKKLAYMYNLNDQKVVSSQYLFEQFITYYIPQ